MRNKKAKELRRNVQAATKGLPDKKYYRVNKTTVVLAQDCTRFHYQSAKFAYKLAAKEGIGR